MKAVQRSLKTAEWTFRFRMGRWAWLAQSDDGEVLATSDLYYATLIDAISNARQNGFSDEDNTGMLNDPQADSGP